MGKIMATLLGLGFAALAVAAQGGAGAQGGAQPTLTNYGRASVKIKTAEGAVVYIDPYVGDYSEPADLILVSHGHGDHNAVDKVKMKPGCIVASPPGAIPAGVMPSGAAKPLVLAEGQRFEAAGISIRAVPAYNKNHKRGETLGYVLAFDAIVLYHAADTSRIPEMAALVGLGITYALLPVDGFYNMGPEEAAECAKLVGAKRSIPIHTSPKDLFLKENAERFASLAPGGLVVGLGASVELKP
jgi:L-ascorbate metabolism protein UlaG (beta-lactamase superfamily)